MYELNKDKLISFIKQISSLKKVIVNDINNNAIIKINSFDKKDGYYYINGIIQTLLSPIYREETKFMVKVKSTKKELILWTKQTSNWNMKDGEWGQLFKSTDTFRLHNVNGKKYLSHSTKFNKINDINNMEYIPFNELEELFIIDNCYSFRDGFLKTFKRIDITILDEEKGRKENKNVIKKFIKKRIKRLKRN